MNAHIVIAGGGTGGHLFPGIAVAEELSQQGAQVSFVGTAKGLEAKVVPQYHYPFYEIDVTGFKGKQLSQKAKSIFQLPRSAWQVRKLIAKLKPQVVIGVGGYASGPMSVVAACYGIPVALLEQNSIPGLTNRIASRFARKVFISFPDTALFFPKGRTEFTGNPIRASLLQLNPIPSTLEKRIRILVLGGSLGARAVNQLVLTAMTILASDKKYQRELLPFVLHQTGVADETKIRTEYQTLGLYDSHVKVLPFIEDMASAYANTDLVIGRAGATTLAELTAIGLPSVLIPLPTAADDHQTQNARFLEKENAAHVLIQNQTHPETLAQLIYSLSTEPQRLSSMAHASRKLGRPHAAKEIAKQILQWV